MPHLPQPSPPSPPISEPQDVDYPGIIRLEVDATDVEHRIFRVREIIPVAGGSKLHLLYPQWLPGYHSPQAPIELMGGLEIFAGDVRLEWRRHPVEMYAFEVEVPEAATEIEARFQLLSPTNTSQGRVIFSRQMFCLPWNGVVLYPAGHFSRRIQVEPSIVLPAGWTAFCALEQASAAGDTIRLERVALDILVDSPLLAGRYARRISLDDSGAVCLNVVADEPDLIEATEEQIAPHRELVRQLDLLFGARPFDHYDMLLALSDDIDPIGVEHHRSCEAVSIPGYFRDWDTTFARRDTLPHEYLHSWNGKFRRGADSWTPSFQDPIRSGLMWVYEGQTQYWDRVLCARSGLWEKDQALQALAEMAATLDVRAGSSWRSLSDTTRDPIIAARASLPWPSWQRSEDYYTEGALIWLDVDTRLRELTGEERSLDDFARSFFRAENGVWTTSTYTFADVVDQLSAVAAYDWGSFLDDKLNRVTSDAPLDGLKRGGYRLVYKQEQSAYQQDREGIYGTADLLYSVGLKLSSDGKVSEVLWDSPAFRAGITAGSSIVAVNQRTFSTSVMKRAITLAADGTEINLLIKEGKRHIETQVDCKTGHRYPHLERIEGTRERLGEILRPIAG